MAFVHGRNTTVLIGAIDLTRSLRSADVSITADVHESTTFGDSAKDYLVGLKDGTVSFEGLWDGDTGKTDETLQALIGAANATPITINPQNVVNTAATSCYLLQARETSYNISSPVGDLVTVSAETNAVNGIMAGVSLVTLQTRVATFNGTAVDNAASSSNGGLGVLHIIVDNFTSAVVKIQHSTDNSSWSDLITFATASTVGSEAVTVSGTVNQYLRGALTTLTGAAIVFTVSFARG